MNRSERLVIRCQRSAALVWRHPVEWLRAAGLLPLVALRLRVAGVQATACWLDRRSTATTRRKHEPAAAGAAAARARELAGVVRLAAVFVPDATCLRRALVLRHLLRRQGIAAEAKIGARPEPDGLAFHAWVEVDGEVVSEPGRRVEGFVPLDVNDPRWPLAAR